MHPSLLFLIHYFGFGVFFFGFFRYLRMGEVLLGATRLMLHVRVGGVYNYVWKINQKKGCVFLYLYLYIIL